MGSYAAKVLQQTISCGSVLNQDERKVKDMRLDRAITRLHQAEHELRTLLEGELRRSQYDSARQLFDYMQRVADLTASMRAQAEPETNLSFFAAPTKPPDALPRFFIRGDRLVKIGRSKQSGSPYYRHEMPRSNFEVLVAWFEGKRTGQWTIGELLTELGECEIPPYQTYLAVAALRRAQVVRLRTRGKYCVTDEAPAPAEWWDFMSSLWPSDDVHEEVVALDNVHAPRE